MDVRYNNNALAQSNDCIVDLLHLGPNIIIFRKLLHSGRNIITPRTVITFKPSTNALDARCKPYLVVAVGDSGGVRNDLFSYKEESLSISERFHFCFEVPLLLFVFFSYSRERYSRRKRVERRESSSASTYLSTWLPFPSLSTSRILQFLQKVS